jgi:sterol desaturase/sphingolipid hydroxylase (fatty acid hydroxylase superfamily)
VENEWLSSILQHYNWLASVLSIGVIIAVTTVGKWLLFRLPALSEMREINRASDKKKWKKEKYPPIVRANQKVGLVCNIVFFIAILPFCVTTATAPLWEILFNVVVILMFYDFFYYVFHRFWFHGGGWMRTAHALHHQARNPTYIDAHYVHPVETFVGLALYMGSIVFLSALLGPFHVGTIVLTFLIYFQVNQINHTFCKLPNFPFNMASWAAAKHHIHHENMQRGNYASITSFYDKLFGTLD